jgi:hypothetical protein
VRSGKHRQAPASINSAASCLLHADPVVDLEGEPGILREGARRAVVQVQGDAVQPMPATPCVLPPACMPGRSAAALFSISAWSAHGRTRRIVTCADTDGSDCYMKSMAAQGCSAAVMSD